MEAQAFESMLDALADTLAEAAKMKFRAELLASLRARIRAWEMPQEAAAKRLGITPPRLNDLLRGKLRKFSLDALVNLSTRPAWSSRSRRTKQPDYALAGPLKWPG